MSHYNFIEYLGRNRSAHKGLTVTRTGLTIGRETWVGLGSPSYVKVLGDPAGRAIKLLSAEEGPGTRKVSASSKAAGSASFYIALQRLSTEMPHGVYLPAPNDPTVFVYDK